LRQSDVRAFIIAANAAHARRLDATEEAFKATVAQAALAFEETCGVGTNG
jgi:hypothetical protein